MAKKERTDKKAKGCESPTGDGPVKREITNPPSIKETREELRAEAFAAHPTHS